MRSMAGVTTYLLSGPKTYENEIKIGTRLVLSASLVLAVCLSLLQISGFMTIGNKAHEKSCPHYA